MVAVVVVFKKVVYLIESLSVKEFWKLVYIRRSYEQK